MYADWCSPCSATVTIEASFQRVSAIVRCGYCGMGTPSYATSVTVNGSMSLTPDGQSKVCQSAGFCGMSSYADPMRASTTYTASGTFTASEMGFNIATKQVSDSETSPAPSVPPGNTIQDKCDGQAGYGQPCSPLVVNLANGAYELSGLDDPVSFDIDADGTPDRVSWTARNSMVAFVALDRNANGVVDNGSELFGDATPTLSGQRAANGFEALRELDVNHDHRVDSTDASWNALLLWTDTNHDGTSQAGELTRLAGSSLVALDTSYRWIGRRDAHGNLYRFQGHGHLRHGTRVIYDVYFRTAE